MAKPKRQAKKKYIYVKVPSTGAVYNPWAGVSVMQPSIDVKAPIKHKRRRSKKSRVGINVMAPIKHKGRRSKNVPRVGKKKIKKYCRTTTVKGSLGRIGSGTTTNHKPLRVLEKRLKRLSNIVAARKKNPKKWA